MLNYFTILDQLSNYNKDDEVPHLEKFGNNLYFSNLFITEDCNLNCVYCFYRDKARVKYSRQEVNWFDYVSFFNSEGKNWLINISGGEPFMYKDIYKLVFELSKKHLVWINSNLTLVDPDNLINNAFVKNLFINASYHYKTLDANPKLYCRWKESFLKMKQAGIRIEVSVVAYPRDLKYLMRLYERLQEEGISPVTFLAYKGHYKGLYKLNRYPESYTKKQKKNY